MLESVIPGDVRGEQLQLVHVGNKSDRCSPTYSTAPAEEEGPPGSCKDAVYSSYVVQHLVEDQNVQVTVLSPWW